MSRLTANPFSKHFEFPRPSPLLTPPDTESDYHAQLSQPVQMPVPLAPAAQSISLPLDVEIPHSHRSVPSGATEVPASRKYSTLSYFNSGPTRDRVVQRPPSVRWLVIVVPPLAVITEQGRFGHTLAIGSPERLSQGILMPLYPTMSGQLGAIAREFAFPSTVGLCLYLHTSVEGFTMAPRISDESWQLLWSSLLEPRSPSGMAPTQLPIGGRIEFDIDLRRARWYESWLGVNRRETVDVPMSVSPSQAQSLSHWRADSRTTFIEEQTQTEDQPDNTSLLLARPSRPPGHRHIPRKLSLIDRLESSSVRSNSKLRNSSPPSPATRTERDVAVRGLSPIVQEEEPRTAKKDVDKLVNNWRETASQASASPLAYTGQTSLDPSNLPNDIPIEDALAEQGVELNLDDFTWSVSSLGPPSAEGWDEDDDDLGSIESWRLPSVHLDRRMAGSVCMTPSTHTSWGPDYGSDYDAFSSISSISRLPSPDIAARQIHDCPATPSTATSWGPASYPASPSLSDTLSLTVSVDIAHRCMGSVPVTPSTATSWGPPLEWPASPATPFYVHTPDVGQRTFDVDGPRPWCHVWPYQGAATAEPEEEVQQGPYPFVFPYYHPTAVVDEAEATGESPVVWQHVWPYQHVEVTSQPAAHQAESVKPWSHVWPYIDGTLAESNDKRAVVVPDYNYPYICIYPSVYPHFSLYPSRAAEAAVEEVVIEENWRTPKPVKAPAAYPDIDIYHGTASYPHNVYELYAPYVAKVQDWRVPRSLKVPALYPDIDIYPGSSTYPRNVYELYASFSSPMPGANEQSEDWRVPKSLKLPALYPDLDIYPGSSPYPKNVYELYAECSGSIPGIERPEDWRVSRSLKVLRVYPDIDIYSGSSPYPRNVYEIYASYEGPIPHSLERPQDWRTSQSLKVPAVYPAIDIYPGASSYPKNVYEIYAPLAGPISDGHEEPSHWRVPRSLQLPALYPAIDIYPGSAPYPKNVYEIYAPSSSNVCIPEDWRTPQSINVPARYPAIDIYPGPSAYPKNVYEIYAPLESITVQESVATSISVRPKAAYPAFDIYETSAKYPYSVYELYASLSLVARAEIERGLQCAQAKDIVITGLGYPHVEPYPPKGYPHDVYNIYSASDILDSRPLPEVYQTNTQECVVVKLSPTYPTIMPYEPVYPWTLESIYPPIKTFDSDQIKELSVSLPRLGYPNIEPYSPVYPYNLDHIYPVAPPSQEARSAQPRAAGKTPAPQRTSRPHHREHAHHAKRGSSGSVSHHQPPPPPVPPLPQNVEVLRPIHPASRKPLEGERVAMSLPVRLPTHYPTICPYPPVYPHFDIYPEAKAAVVVGENSSMTVHLEAKYPALELYRPVYPFIEIYPTIAVDNVSASPLSSVVAAKPEYHYLPRRKPKHTHDELYRMVFGESGPETDLSEQEQVVTVTTAVVQPITLPAATSLPSPVPTSPKSPRQLPPIPAYGPVPTSPSQSPVVPSPMPSPSIRSRTRSGTVSSRPPLPTPPAQTSPLLASPSTPPSASSATGSPTRSIRRLPSLPSLAEDPSNVSPSPSPRARPLSMRVGMVGLPSNPAPRGRRMSIAQPPASRSSTFMPLPPLPEPSGIETQIPISLSRRPLPQPQPLLESPEITPHGTDLQRSNSNPMRPPLVPSPTEGSPDLARHRSLPARPLPRARRDSVATPPTGLVAGLARAYTASLPKVDESLSIASTLSQFPTPPRPPLPPIPVNATGGRPVSRLDRSKYPFA